VVFIGGFAALMLAVSIHFRLSHSGRPEELHGTTPPLIALGSLLALTTLARALAGSHAALAVDGCRLVVLPRRDPCLGSRAAGPAVRRRKQEPLETTPGCASSAEGPHVAVALNPRQRNQVVKRLAPITGRR
jgi:hypothetical protein